jgi:hypothetical protein
MKKDLDWKAWAARSGIQKAVRRGDVSLAKTCFDLLWPVKPHRRWLLVRLRSIVCEDCWHMLGELGKAYSVVDDTWTEEALRAHWLKFTILLTIARKNQDCGWGWHLIKNSGFVTEHPEYKLTKKLFDFAVKHGGPEKIPEEVLLEFFCAETPDRDFSSYEDMALSEAAIRSRAWGLESDRWMGLMALVLITLRGLPEIGIKEMLDAQRERFCGEKVSTLADLPYYCFDMHTRPGKMAIRAWKKNYGKKFNLPDGGMEALTFHCMSALVLPRVWMPICYFSEERFEWCGQAWLAPSKEDCARWLGFPDWKRASEFWAAEVEDDLIKLIRWAVSKVAEEK